MAEHILKVVEPYFDDLLRGKPFEVRENDRDFAVGDVLTLWEYLARTTCSRFPCAECRPRFIQRNVTYVYSGDARFGHGTGGLQPGFVVLGIAPRQQCDGLTRIGATS